MKKLITSNHDFVVPLNSIVPCQNNKTQVKILSSKLSLKAFIPNRNKLGGIIPNYQYWLDSTVTIFNNIFGGSYKSISDSCYVTNQGNLVLEDTQIFSGSLFSPSQYCEREAVVLLLQHLVMFGIKTQQESLLFSINGVEKKIIF